MIDKELARYVKHLHDTGYLLSNPIVAAQAIHNGWITFTVNRDYDESYEVTNTGDIAFALGITEGIAAAPVPAQPVHSAPEAAGMYKSVYNSRSGHFNVVNADVTLLIMDSKEVAKSTAEVLNEETSKLRAENASLRERIVSLEAENRLLEEKGQTTALSALNVTSRFEQSAMNAQDEIAVLKNRLQKELNRIVDLEHLAYKVLNTICELPSGTSRAWEVQILDTIHEWKVLAKDLLDND